MSSSSAQLRKIKKPLIERRRRERINDSLNQLKNLVLEATNKDETRYSKMEKADILEMTVTYLRATHCRRRSSGEVIHGGSVDRYAAGFRECAVHVGQYLLDAGVSFGAVHDRLMLHLEKALQAVDGRLPDAGFCGTEKAASWSDDCDTTGRCTPDSDDSGSVSGTVSDVDDVIRQQYGKGATPMTSSLTHAIATTTTPTYRLALHPAGDGDSPRRADEFPSLTPSSTVTATDDCSSLLLTSVINDIGNDLVVTSDVQVTSPVDIHSSLTSSSITDSDIITDDTSDIWQPWR